MQTLLIALGGAMLGFGVIGVILMAHGGAC
jgi:uncharacterized membrane protein YbaN (DUF454 family)